MRGLVWFGIILASIIFALVIAATVSRADDGACVHDANTLRCVEYHKALDGDSVLVTVPNTHPYFGWNKVVRIWGIDAPEIVAKQNCEKAKAEKATLLTHSILSRAKRIDLHLKKRGVYNQLLADVVADGVSLTTIFAKTGLAVPYFGEGRKPSHRWCGASTDDFVVPDGDGDGVSPHRGMAL